MLNGILRTSISRMLGNSAHQRYVETLRTWADQRAAIVGTQDKPDSLTYISRQIYELDQLPTLLASAREARTVKVKDIFAQIEKIVLVYRTLYHPVHEFVMRNQVAKKKFDLQFDASIVTVGLDETVLGKVNLNRKGSFNGVEEGKRALKNMAATADFQTASGVASFCNDLMSRFYRDHRSSPPVSVSLMEQ